jgi:hypothetical protein
MLILVTNSRMRCPQRAVTFISYPSQTPNEPPTSTDSREAMTTSPERTNKAPASPSGSSPCPVNFVEGRAFRGPWRRLVSE